MKLQTKILVHLSLITTVILLFFISYQFIRFRESKLLHKENLKSQEKVIDKILELNRAGYEQLISDNSSWDEMVAFAANPDTIWAKENVDFFVNSFQLSFVSVFNIERKPIYYFGDREIRKEIWFLDEQLLVKLFEKKSFPHFFVKISDKLVEVFGATIVPAFDADQRETIPQGYIFIGKCWDKTVLDEIAQASNYITKIEFTSDSGIINKTERKEFIRVFNDYLNVPVAKLHFYGDDPFAKGKKLLLILSFTVLFFAMVSLIVLMIYFSNTVIKPLKQISESLGKGNPGILKSENDSTYEFKQIRELIAKYFEQEQELKANFVELTEINTVKNKLFSIVALNLKNPVEGLVTLSELLEDSLKRQDVETTKELLDMIGNQANQTLFLLETLFDWSRMQSDQITFNPEILNLKIILDQVLHDMMGFFTTKRISVSVEGQQHISVYADYYMIKAILRNLISNSIKYTYSEGWVKIKIDIKDNFAIIAVQDNGLGMSNEAIETLFITDKGQPKIGTDNERGTGLGLIICDEFVKKNGGKICVESTLGKGSVFKFTIPLAAEYRKLQK